MNIKKNGFISQLDNPFGLGEASTNLCQLGRGILIWTPVKMLLVVALAYEFILVPIAVLAAFLFEGVFTFMWVPFATLLMALIFAGFILVAELLIKSSHTLGPKVRASELYAAYKDKFCPLVSWTKT